MCQRFQYKNLTPEPLRPGGGFFIPLRNEFCIQSINNSDVMKIQTENGRTDKTVVAVAVLLSEVLFCNA